VSFSCVLGGTPKNCLEKLSSGDAEIVSFGASDAFSAYKGYGFAPIAMETYGGELGKAGADYYSVAVVNKAMCAGNPTLASLKGKDACFTGYRRSAGWVLPVGEMVESGIMPLNRNGVSSDVQDDAASVHNFFGKVCAPGVKEPDGPLRGGKPWDEMCELCAGDCSATDPYADYEGPVRCVLSGAGAVGFTKHSTILEMAETEKGGEDLRLLCPSGGCKPLSEFASCSMSRVPAHSIVASNAFAATPAADAARDALIDASRSATWLKGLTELNGVKNAVFKAGTEGLVPVTGGAEDYFGQSLARYQGVDRLSELAAQASQGGGSSNAAASGGSAPAGWLSPGAAAGLGIGTTLLGAGLGAGGMWFANKRRSVPAAGGSGFDAYATKGFVAPA
jgi:melanoma-associated antigen p97